MKHIHAGVRKASVALGLAMAAVSAQALDSVTVAYPQPVGPHNGDFGFGVKLGIFREEGIDLKMVGFAGSGQTVPQVAQKRVTAALAHPDLALQALGKGQPFPIMYVYNWRRRSPYEIAVKADSPLKTLADLKGKRLGIGALTWANIPMTRIALADVGIKWQQDVTVVPLGVGPAAWRQLDTGAVDAVNYYTAEHEKIRQSGIPLRLLPFPENLQDMFTNGLIVHHDLVKDNPGLVERLGRAVAKSTIACMSNYEACVAGAWELDATLKPEESKRAEWVNKNVNVIRMNVTSLAIFGAGQPKEWGRFPAEGWATHVRVLSEAGLVKPNLDVSGLYTNKFVPAYNKFNAAEIESRAKKATW